MIKHGLSNTRLYRIHQGMKQRCYKATNCHYSLYGEKGIFMSAMWLGENGFVNFYNWAMQNGYKDDLTIDRIDNKRSYVPSNCRWITAGENASKAAVDTNRGTLKWYK